MEINDILSFVSTETLLSLRRDIDLLLKTRKPIGNKITEIGLSTRAVNVLACNGITFIEDLEEYSQADFVRFKFIGKKSISEIKELMSKYNVNFIN